ncbi:MAG TPA: exodeoxyribonuclease V subunit beta [Luteimonas sp.]|nr:exodeoxyribonuclease V subunit beta [Luteimonas sp.]
MNAPAQLAPPCRDPYLDLPLDGLRLIEASAGTGKTFTLATLATRLVVEGGLRVSEILAVTFTEAATQELRRRIRERLERAAALVDAPPAHDSGTEDALSRAIVERHLAAGTETRVQLARRLRQAALEMDLAAVFTIHGFCARVLREHALETGHAFDAPTLLTSDAALREELAADLWRSIAVDANDAQALLSLWSGPEALRDDLPALLSRDPLKPDAGDAPADPTPTFDAAATRLREAFAAHGDDLRAALDTALQAKILNAGAYKPGWIDRRWRELRDWCALARANTDVDDSFERLTPDGLRARTNKGGIGRTPQSPLCEAMATFLVARARLLDWRRAQACALLHRLRLDARARLDARKRVRRVQTFDDLIDGVADALDGAAGDALAAALRAQYRIALVDEFQDTDPRQWAIFERVFGRAAADAPPALFLIGDPKQAIYGFRGGDVHTYLQAADAGAQRAPPLDRNFRSRPGVLRAIDALYANAGTDAFLDPRIRFHPVQPGGGRGDHAFTIGGMPAPALTLRMIRNDPDAPQATAFSADRSRELATRACVAQIHALLRDARAGRVMIDGRPLQAGDIAVLVRRHHEATRIQCALGAAGIAAVSAGQQSLFATDEARELLALFEALLQPADEGRLRAALATVLLGQDAAAIARLDVDPERLAAHQRDAQAWRERWLRSGPLALVAELAARAGERLLGLLDGERRLSNVLQLAETMQEAQARAPGLHAQLDWLRWAIAEADPRDETQLLRLESDARRVQIVTLHKSKGLEYPLVLLPFAGIGGKNPDPGRRILHHVDGARELRWKVDKAAPEWTRACADFEREQRAEDARLLYVGLTRAQHALWLASGPFFNAGATPLSPMLRDTDALVAQPDIVVDAAPLQSPPAPLPVEQDARAEPVRVAQRRLSGDWWVYSFTQLVKGAGHAREAAATASERGADDEAMTGDVAAAAIDTGTALRFGGSRFGNVLHDALEHVDFAAWRDWRGGDAPAGEDAALRAAVQRGGYAAAELDDAVAAVRPLVGHTLVTVLPEGVRLCDVPEASRRAEMEFHFALQPTAVERLLALLHAHGVLSARDGFGARRTLEGLMTGKIDLTYTHAGRWYVLDYKSNRLPAYDADTLVAAMAHSGYDLQALIYTVALHRWLRFRLGDAYDYARDFGGVRYLFCRGLALGSGDGVHAWQPPPPLVHALDALFAGRPVPEPA